MYMYRYAYRTNPEDITPELLRSAPLWKQQQLRASCDALIDEVRLLRAQDSLSVLSGGAVIAKHFFYKLWRQLLGIVLLDTLCVVASTYVLSSILEIFVETYYGYPTFNTNVCDGSLEICSASPKRTGLYAAGGIVAIHVFTSCVRPHITLWKCRLQLEVRGALTTTLCYKLLNTKVSVAEALRYDDSMADIYNLITLDIPYIVEYLWNCIFYLSLVARLSVFMKTIYKQLGSVSIIGLSLLGLIVLTIFVLELWCGAIKWRYLKLRDARIAKTQQVMMGVRSVRLTGWENVVFDRIDEAREAEMKIRTRRMLLFGMASGLAESLEPFLRLAVFAPVTLFGAASTALQGLRPAAVFAAVHVASEMAEPLVQVSFAANGMIEGSLSIIRYQAAVLSNPMITDDGENPKTPRTTNKNMGEREYNVTEAEELPFLAHDTASPGADETASSKTYATFARNVKEEIVVCHGVFQRSWVLRREQDDSKGKGILGGQEGSLSKDSSSFTVEVSNFRVCLGDCVTLMGDAGSGKTSVLLGLLGELRLQEGYCRVGAQRSALFDRITNKAASSEDNTDRDDTSDSFFCASGLGSIGYVSQIPWIPAGTVRSIILFGRPYTEEHYNRVLYACALHNDVMINWANHGDAFYVTQGGSNLSAGQRERIALARAVYGEGYAAPRLCLLDMPLKSVDPHTSNFILDQLFGVGGLLSHTATILIEDTSKVDHLHSDLNVEPPTGCVHFSFKRVAQGSVTDADILPFHTQNIAATDYMRLSSVSTNVAQSDESRTKTQDKAILTTSRSDQLSRPLCTPAHTSVDVSARPDIVERMAYQSALCSSNSRAIPRVDHLSKRPIVANDYFWYLKRVGFAILLRLVFYIVLVEVASICALIWVSYWTTEPSSTNHSTAINDEIPYSRVTCARIASAFFFIAGIGVPFNYITQIKGCLKAARRIHTETLRSLLSLPYYLYDCLSVASIMNRLSKDLHEIDSNTLYVLTVFLSAVCALLLNVSVVSVLNACCFFVLFFVGFAVYRWVYRIYQPCASSFQNLQLQTLTPLCDHFQEVVTGASVIRAFKAENVYFEENLRLTGSFCGAQFLQFGCTAVASLRTDFILLPLVLVVSMFPDGLRSNLVPGVVATTINGWLSRWSFVSPRLAGLQMGLILGLPSLVKNVLYASVNRDASMCSIVRVAQLSDVPSCLCPAKDHPPPVDVKATLEHAEHFELRDITARLIVSEAVEGRGAATREKGNNVEDLQRTTAFGGHWQHTEPVLRHVSEAIHAGDHVAIVGHTGSGKSTLLLGILKYVLMPKNSGVAINGDLILSQCSSETAIHQFGIAVLPKEPFSVNGCTVKQLLDPHDEFDLASIECAVEAVGLRDVVEACPCRYDTRIMAEPFVNTYSLSDRDPSSNTLGKKEKAVSAKYVHDTQLFCSDIQLRCLMLARLTLHKKLIRLLLVDEPPMRLDINKKATNVQLETLFRTHFPHATVVIATHDDALVRQCNAAWLLAYGRVVAHLRTPQHVSQETLAGLIQHSMLINKP